MQGHVAHRGDVGADSDAHRAAAGDEGVGHRVAVDRDRGVVEDVGARGRAERVRVPSLAAPAERRMLRSERSEAAPISMRLSPSYIRRAAALGGDTDQAIDVHRTLRVQVRASLRAHRDVTVSHGLDAGAVADAYGRVGRSPGVQAASPGGQTVEITDSPLAAETAPPEAILTRSVAPMSLCASTRTPGVAALLLVASTVAPAPIPASVSASRVVLLPAAGKSASPPELESTFQSGRSRPLPASRPAGCALVQRGAGIELHRPGLDLALGAERRGGGGACEVLGARPADADQRRVGVDHPRVEAGTLRRRELQAVDRDRRRVALAGWRPCCRSWRSSGSRSWCSSPRTAPRRARLRPPRRRAWLVAWPSASTFSVPPSTLTWSPSAAWLSVFELALAVLAPMATKPADTPDT